MNAVIYARYSSNAQTEQSIEGQLRVCKEYAERNKLNILYEYIDRALTGTNDNRPSFLQMIEDAENKQFEYILVYKLDRFSRNKYDNVVYKHKLAQYGVKVLSATEMISDTPEGAVMEGLLEMFAEMYSKDLSQKVKRGMRESAIKGNFLGGTALYGYKVVDKKMVIDEEKAPAIEYLFNEYASGKPKKQIIEELNKMGYRGRNGKPLCLNSFQNNLSNKKYIGVYDNGEVQNNNYYPAIIDKELFDKVQEKLKEHKLAPATQKAPIEYLLTGKVFCGHCGANMVGVSGTGKLGTKHCYYACISKTKKHACTKKNERKDYLEKYVVEQTLNYILTPEQIEKISSEMLEEWNKDTTTLKIKELEKQITKIENELDKCFNMFYNTNNAEMQKRMNEKADSLTIQKQDIEEEIKKLKLAQKITHSKEDIKNALSVYLDGNIDNLDFQRRIISKFVNSVYVFDDKIAVYYNLFGNHKVTFEEAKETIKQSESGVRILKGAVHQIGYYINFYSNNVLILFYFLKNECSF